MPYCYILECNDDAFYVGSTWNLDRRVTEHNAGLGARFTSRRLPVRVAWAEDYDSISEAFSAEKKIQNWSCAKRLALIEGRLEDLPSLARNRMDE